MAYSSFYPFMFLLNSRYITVFCAHYGIGSVVEVGSPMNEVLVIRIPLEVTTMRVDQLQYLIVTSLAQCPQKIGVKLRLLLHRQMRKGMFLEVVEHVAGVSG